MHGHPTRPGAAGKTVERRYRAVEGVALDPRVQDCTGIAGMDLRFRGDVTVEGANIIGLCCESKSNIPEIPFFQTPEETLERIIGMRNVLFLESVKYCDNYANAPRNHYLAHCIDCASFQTNYSKGHWTFQPQIGRVHMGIYPSPCQARCCYCRAPKSWENSNNVKDGYDKMFRIIKLAEKTGLINPNALWEVVSGEIAIHPYKNEFLEAVKEKKTQFFSNCMVYDEKIAQHLSDIEGSSISFSIDSGTKETWRKVKGIDNFEESVRNFKRYCRSSKSVSNFQLKYIVLPGINDTKENYEFVMALMHDTGIKALMISRDDLYEYQKMNNLVRILTISATARLVALCRSNGFRPRYIKYSLKEIDEIERVAAEQYK